MATKTQIILPIVVISIGIGAFIGISSLKKPPEEKPPVDNTPLVSVQNIEFKPMTFSVSSYGVVNAKYETELISQVNGEIVYLSDKFVKGGFVKKGEILAKIDPSDYESNLLDAQAKIATANASLIQEKANAAVAEQEWSRITEGKPTELSLRKPQLAQAIASLKSAEASLHRAERDLERTIIKAPYDSLIATRNIGLGSYVAPGSAIGLMLGTEVAEVRLPLADKEIQYLESRGADAKVQLVGSYAGSKQQWAGKIVRSEGVVDSKSRMTYLVAQIDDPYGLNSPKPELRYGTYVTATINGSDAGDVTIIPRYLVVNGKVAVMDEDNTLRYKAVDIIRQEGSNVVVSSGLESGMRVITSALDYPVEGMVVALPQDKLLQSEPEQQAPQTDLAMGAQ
ncbi:efflux RND transporter periplasmic adaptor subunit [Shewanella sp. WXL01]|uniref:Efflux RND transporter periplasmic adaptor subunit n=1 Tax=Shewanella maritima TaxID=2520507 RepID=A0A411PCX0_9GAMM|nr:efflux RND transporter periplasmic adaptor subunit [Shewanella maritima]NKF50642.1 efflux RND transporter periplasmic adaptor subunit [Shewanella sp. WXL01]QBF81371.1 efflux RND transporter periplasmic adaptor subunit [Shewanella maritima]